MKSWIIRGRKEVAFEAVIENCTEQQAMDYEGDLVEETELDTINVRVESVEPKK